MKEFKKYTGLVLLILGLLSLFWGVYVLNKFNEGMLDLYEKLKNASMDKQTSFEMYKNTTLPGLYIPIALQFFVSFVLAIVGSILLIGVNGEKEK